MSYLYGASVQGIQGFIFETSKLKEMVGGSELVENICSEWFDKVSGGKGENIQKAAGNIRHIFENEGDCQAVVKSFPKRVVENAPGITISQAVVKFGGDGSLQNAMDELEKRLKIQRNRQFRPAEIGLMAVARSPRTGKPAVDYKDEGGKARSAGCRVKQEAGKPESSSRLIDKLGYGNEKWNFPYNFEEMTDEKVCDWLAVIHADGNSLGKLLQTMGGSINSDEDLKVARSEFSKALDTATCAAAKEAFDEIIKPEKKGDKGKYPLRPVILGGDDLTVVCRADLALPFAKAFLLAFKERSKENLAGLVAKFKLNDFSEGLTACAGIAFMKDSYPFHYGIDMAETLCRQAKKAAKKVNETNVPSTLSFYKIQSSFITDYDDIVERVLTATDSGVRFDYGPYCVDGAADLPSLDGLLEKARLLKRENAPKSGVRRWLSALHDDAAAAEQLMKRITQVHDRKICKGLGLENPFEEKEKTGKLKFTDLYDAMTIATLPKGGEAK